MYVSDMCMDIHRDAANMKTGNMQFVDTPFSDKNTSLYQLRRIRVKSSATQCLKPSTRWYVLL